MAITQDIIDRETKFEGSIPYMYLDTNSNVTVGVGHLIANANDAASLPFVDLSNNPQPVAQIQTDFAAVTGATPGQVASAYQSLTTSRLSPGDVSSILGTDLGTVETGLISVFGSYNSFPASAQAGLIDMAFNLGLSGLQSKFPTFCSAVQSQDWATAAAQCHRLGIPDNRNDEVKQLFLTAGGGFNLKNLR